MVDRRPFVLVVNPRAGAGRARARLPGLKAAFREAGATFETVLTRGPGHATRLVREALSAGTAGVAVVGGDGTLNEAVNGFFTEGGEPSAPGAWLGTLPCGTGGDFRKTLGLTRDTGAMATHMMWARPRPVDAGWLTFRDHQGRPASRAFINIASFGMGGLVDRKVNASPKWMGGAAAFFVGSVRAMVEYKNRRVRITIDDDAPRDTDVVNVAVANGRFFGGGMQIAPEAKIDDGLFDVVGLEGMTRIQQATMAPHLYRGSILSYPGVTHRRARRVVAEAQDWGGPVLLDVDGEAPGGLPATFEIRPGAIQLRG